MCSLACRLGVQECSATSCTTTEPLVSKKHKGKPYLDTTMHCKIRLIEEKPCVVAHPHLNVLATTPCRCSSDYCLMTQFELPLQVHLTVDSARGSIQIVSIAADMHTTLHMSADICKLATHSQQSLTAAVQQPTAAERLLASLMVTPQDHSAALTATVQQQPLKASSAAESMITRTDASLQLGILFHETATGIAVAWDAVRVIPADSHVQQHAVVTTQEATCRQELAVDSMVSVDSSPVAKIQGLVAMPLAACVEAARLTMSPALEATRSPAEGQSHKPSWLSGPPAEDRRSSIQSVVMSTVTRLLGSDSISEDEPLMAAGLDSLGATELVQSLQTAFDISLPATVVFDYPTVSALAAFVSQQTTREAGQMPEPHAWAVVLGPSPFSSGRGETSHMALIAGVAGDQKDLQHWTHGDAITRVPHSRWDISQQAKSSGMGDSLAPQFGSFLNDVDQFDSALFGIMASEALTVDPQQRLLLQTALGAFPNGAGPVRGRAVGAYVGIGTSDYNTLMQQANVPFNAFSFTAGSASVASGRLSFAFGLQGPTASIDTACSASLVAAHMACQSFR